MGRQVYRLLSIYDGYDWVGRMQGGHTGRDTYTARVESLGQLKALLDRLVAAGMIFQNAIFTTHGGPGRIRFGDEDGDERLTREVMFKSFYDGRYPRLFPFEGTKLYFDGCNVAEGEEGWRFLEAAARTFLRHAGGMAYGWTSYGIGMPSWVPYIGSHTIHLTGRARYVLLSPATDGAAYMQRYPTEADAIDMPPARRERDTLVAGMKF